jgi:probable rRNA maturation factor
VDVIVETAPGVEPPFDATWIERVVAAAVSVGAQTSVGETVQVVILLADDATLHDLNRRFRQIDKPTDVLSFEGDAEASSPACAVSHLGDVALSIERARRQAEDYGHSVDREVAYLLTHGTLHLLGYDHEDDADQRRMRAAEERALESLGLSRGAAA